VTVSNPADTAASEFGWHSTGTTSYTVTRGNNAIAQTNPSGGNTYLTNYRPSGGSSNNYVFPFTTSSTPPTSYVDASVTQLFYTSNMYHDLLHTLGFNEAAGNFEVNNNVSLSISLAVFSYGSITDFI
jgi:extracellular elastinolytic metalloproteinase